ncbi:hypothetical protein [Phyllobacterium sp. 0TCS1.6C]|nr:hypothetical protein [Phyllobacterium sp. 0TCS1.6C]
MTMTAGGRGGCVEFAWLAPHLRAIHPNDIHATLVKIAATLLRASTSAA